MSQAVIDFWTAAEALVGGSSGIRHESNGGAELFIPTPLGTLEVSGRGDFVSVACGCLFIEDRPVRSSDDAKFLLAVCDAIVAGRAKVATAPARVELLTRGYSQVWAA